MAEGKVSAADVDALFASMPAGEARRALRLADALEAFGRSADKRAAAASLAAAFGARGASYPSLMRKLALYRREGVWALAPAKYRRAAAAGVAGNAAFAGHWRALVLENRRKMRPAWRRLIREFAAGEAVPGVGTWRDLYLKLRGYAPSEGEPCPWDERDPPPGWGFRNLSRLRPDAFSEAAARRGMASAKAAFLPKAAKTRVGLECCRVVEVDDMWYEQKVVYGGNLAPRRVLEFAAMDVLTAHVICRLAKPVRERADGTRETLPSRWVRYIYHYVLCVSGIPAGGCVIRGERGTARADAGFLAALEDVNRWRSAAGLGPVSFEGGALENEPLARGLPDGAAKGNPRNKPRVEQMHATLKNEMGHVLGEVGGGRGVQPEETGAMVAEASRLAAMARAAGVDPEAVKTCFLSWPEFLDASEEAHRNMDRRVNHALEGWAECGFTKGEIREPGGPWRSLPRPADMAPGQRGAVAALVKGGLAEFREVDMSPAEAWEKSRGALMPVPAYLSPAVLGEEFRRVAKVRQDLTLRFRDPDIGAVVTVEAAAGGRELARGAEYSLWINPLDAGRAYVRDLQGRYLGVAKVVRAVRADASPEELAAQLGMRQRALAAARKRLGGLAGRRLAAANARAAANLALFGEADPAADAARARLAAAELADAPELEGEVPLSLPDGGDGAPEVSDEDLAAAAAALAGARGEYDFGL